MNDHRPPTPPRSEQFGDARRALIAAIVPIRVGVIAIGIALALAQIDPLIESPRRFGWGHSAVALSSALLLIGGAVMVAWSAGMLVRASAEVLDVLAGQDVAGVSLLDDGRALAIREIREAIAGGTWDRAEALAEAFARDFPDAPQVGALVEEVAAGKGEQVEGLKARIAASRQANDAEGVVTLRDQLAKYVRGPDLRDFDRDLVRWLMMLLQRRMRAGTVRADVAALAARIADRFGDLPEGASLRASLPTLRRSAGLCPRCAGPYLGIDDACPECLGPGALPTPLAPGSEGDDAGDSLHRIDPADA